MDTILMGFVRLLNYHSVLCVNMYTGIHKGRFA